MLDPGRYFAEAIYFLQYTLAQILWAVDRATLSIAVIAESVNAWVTDNVGYFVELLVNALSAPLGGMFILALTALGVWYLLNNVVPTGRWVDPGKLLTYGLIALFFFSSPIVVVDLLEDLRQSLTAGIDQALIDGAAGDVFATGMDGTDDGLPAAIPDVNGDGVVASFDLVAAFMLVANVDELDSSEFPVDFEATYFPFGDPSGIDLSDEADQELAKALASDGIERLFFALVAIPTAVAEHFLHLALTGVAMFLYAGVPFAMLFAFFVYTQAFLGTYLSQFVNLLIETFMSVVIAAIMMTLLAAAAQQGIGLYIAASLITFIVLLWRIKSALHLAAAAFNLFGGGALTGGAGGMEMATMGRRAVAGVAGVAGAALTGGATLAAGGAVMATAAALQADGRAGGAYLGTDPAKADGRARQLKTIAGYTLGRSETVRGVVEGAHEVRTLTRNFRDGAALPQTPDVLDYLRVGSSMSGFGSSPWLAMYTSPSLRGAYAQIGGRRAGYAGAGGHPVREAYAEDGAPVGGSVVPGAEPAPEEDLPAGGGGSWREEPATPRQITALRTLGVDVPEDLRRGAASDQILRARQREGREEGQRSSPAQSGPGNAPDRLASLEEALVALTAALTDPETAGRMPGARTATPTGTGAAPAPTPSAPAGTEPAPTPTTPLAPEMRTGEDDGPGREMVRDMPDDGVGRESVPDANVAGAGTDLNRPEDGDDARGETVPAGTVQFEPQDEARRTLVDGAIAGLADSASPAGRGARRALVVFAGEENAARVQEAVAQHTAPAVQDAAAAVAGVVGRYRDDGLSDAAILAAFRRGDAAIALREVWDTPLDDAQLAAVADTVLLPQRRLTRTELVAAIGREAAAGATSEQAVVEAIGSPVGFGGQTGTVRGVMAGARSMRLTPAEMARLADLIRDGLHEAVRDELIGRGHRPDVVHEFVSDVAALPGAVTVPQTTASDAPAGRQSEGTQGDNDENE